MSYIARHQIVGGPDHPVHLPQESLELLIASGMKSGVPAAVEALLEAETPLEIIDRRIIPALDRVGAAPPPDKRTGRRSSVRPGQAGRS